MERIFEIQGALCDASGGRLAEVIVALVDRDLLRDDLLGVGRTDRQGRFRLAFTESEFNQEWLERETEPDLYLVASIYPSEHGAGGVDRDDPDEPLVAVARLELAGHDFSDGPVDLDRLPVPGWEDGPTLLPDQEPIPGLGKQARRLKVNDELVRYCLAEVAPRVARLTRWPGLTDDLRVHVVRDMKGYVEALFEALDLPPDALATRLLSGVLNRKVFALYEPLLDAVWVNARTTRHCNLDGLKVILGHELVHVGQFRRGPELAADHGSQTRALLESDTGDKTLAELVEELAGSAMQRQMEELEGYAMYIQSDFLEKHYNCSMIVHHVSVLDRALMYLLHRFGPGEDLETVETLKREQYDKGRERYRDRQKSDAPARFEPRSR